MFNEKEMYDNEQFDADNGGNIKMDGLDTIFNELNREDEEYALNYNPDADEDVNIGYQNVYKSHPFGKIYRALSPGDKCRVFEELIQIIKDTEDNPKSRIRQEAFTQIYAALYGVVAGFLQRMCVKYAKSEQRYDMLQHGYLGILMHLYEYDATKGQPSTFFLPHAKWGFNEAMRLANGSSKHYSAQMRKVRQAISVLEGEGLPFTIVDIVRKTNLKTASVEHALRLMQIEAASNVEDSLSVTSQEDTPEVAAEVAEKKDVVRAAILTLPQFQQDVVNCYFSIYNPSEKKNTLTYVSKRLGKSPDSVKKAFNKALRTLRENLGDYYKGKAADTHERDCAIEGAAIETITLADIYNAELDLID